ncbi:GntR family transcriptional regulator [Paenibacillus sp. DMB20]|uniref:GntR family transcriptional regulator n=1 Tax=Paenibacillus sp. DMB20 TaxID=1642570 RepID=UPI000627B259|nr:GntR family transcriptional regulator [Paenibacillus sp. DMB20]KKO53879.1 GntR family transcriptional regulator [Paenibacillus sp. DMB20]
MSLRRNDKPLYVQLKNIIKDRILHGVYPLHENIPPEPQLEKEFGVSKITVRGAIQELVQEGYLEKGSGKGTKVIRNTSGTKLSRLKRFTEVLVEEGHQIQKVWLRSEIAENPEGSEPWRLFGKSCLKLERVYVLDQKPYIHYTHYLSADIGELELNELKVQSLYELLEERHISFGRLRDEFAVAVPPADVAEVLGVPPGAPLLKRSRYSCSEEGSAVEYSEGFYNTELQSYVVNYDV